MKLAVFLDEDTIREIVTEYINEKFGIGLVPSDLPITVKSKNNYKEQEWEPGKIRIIIEVER